EARWRAGAREVAVERTRHGNVALTERAPRPVIDEHSWGPGGCLSLAGTYLGPPGSALDLVLRNQDTGDEHLIGCGRDGSRFSARIEAAAMPTLGDARPLRDGPWDVLARPRGDGAGPVTGAGYDHARLAEISHRKVTAGPKLYAFTTADYDSPVITAEPRLPLSEQSNFNRRGPPPAPYPLPARRPPPAPGPFVRRAGEPGPGQPPA